LGDVGEVGDCVLGRFGLRPSRGYMTGERHEKYGKYPLPPERPKLRKPRQTYDPKCILGCIAEGVKAGLPSRDQAARDTDIVRFAKRLMSSFDVRLDIDS
jgi:hypothetical protein